MVYKLKKNKGWKHNWKQDFFHLGLVDYVDKAAL